MFPARWCPDIEPGAALDQEPHHRLVAAQDGLVQRCGMRVVAFGVVAVGIRAGIEQQPNNRRMSVLRSKRERAVARRGVRGGKQAGGIVHQA